MNKIFLTIIVDLGLFQLIKSQFIYLRPTIQSTCDDTLKKDIQVLVLTVVTTRKTLQITKYYSIKGVRKKRICVDGIKMSCFLPDSIGCSPVYLRKL